MAVLFALLRILKGDDDSRSGWTFALCGFMVAWTTVNELPAASFAAIAFVLAYRRSAKQTLKLWLPAAALPVIALVATNVIATGSWKPVYADYGTDKYRFVIEVCPVTGWTRTGSTATSIRPCPIFCTVRSDITESSR